MSYIDYIDYEFSMMLRVRDPEALLAAALAHPDAVDGDYTRDNLLDAYGEIDINHCLIMLLDPGVSPAGCEILDSVAERV